jgi:endoglucanase
MKPWKQFIFASIIALFGVVCITCDNNANDDDPRPASPEPMSEKTAMQYFTDEGITVGWNLGNTLDAVNSWSYKNPTAEEGCWGNPLANQTLFNGVKEQGFDIVRIPITWTGHIGSAPDYKVSPAKLRRVAEVAGYAKKAGLKAIINMHHDDGANHGGWLLLEEAAADQNSRAQITDKFERVWTQIAEYFKDFGDWLIFESMNEVHDVNWGWSLAFQSNPQLFIDIVNEWNQCFTDAVRSTGSNNAQRFLMYPSHASSPESILPDGSINTEKSGQYFKLPTDSSVGRQIVTFHYYDSSEASSNGTAIEWGTQEEKNAVDNLFGRAKKAFINNNIPVVIGEVARWRVSGINSDGSAMTQQQLTRAAETRLLWSDYVFTKAKQNGLVPVWWDNGVYKPAHEIDQFGLFNRNTGKPNSDENTEIINAITMYHSIISNNDDDGDDDGEDNGNAAWWKWVEDSANNLTLNFEEQQDGIVRITVSGTPSPDRWKAIVGYTNPAQILQQGKYYKYQFEMWTDSETRNVNVQYYGDDATDTYFDVYNQAVTTEHKTYEIISNVPHPKAKPAYLGFQCGDTVGVFYVKIISITEVQ